MTEAPHDLDRTSYEPIYAQLVNLLAQQIHSGNLRPGDQLPTEAQLCERYQISPMTVRRAINILADQGLVTTARGKGTFVRSFELTSATFDLDTLLAFFRDPTQTQIRILEARIVEADETIARRLQIPAGEKTIFIRRLLRFQGRPAFYHREYLIYDPRLPIVEAEMEVTALQGLFGAEHVTGLKGGTLAIEATALNGEEAKLLATSSGSPAFCIEHVFHDFQDVPVSWGWFLCRGDLLRFSASVGAGR